MIIEIKSIRKTKKYIGPSNKQGLVVFSNLNRPTRYRIRISNLRNICWVIVDYCTCWHGFFL